MTDETKGGAFYQTPRFSDRVWRWFGFRYARVDRRLIDELDAEPEKWLTTDTMIRLSWDDRLRLLFSGCANLRLEQRTDVCVKSCVNLSAFTVLPPGRI